MGKAKISEMEIIDVLVGKPQLYSYNTKTQDEYVITYRGITYLRESSNSWQEFLPEGNFPNKIGVYDYSFQTYLFPF